MAINTCDNHDDVLVVWTYGRECPLCNVIEQVDSLKNKLEVAEGEAEGALDRLREVQEELREASRLEE